MKYYNLCTFLALSGVGNTLSALLREKMIASVTRICFTKCDNLSQFKCLHLLSRGWCCVRFTFCDHFPKLPRDIYENDREQIIDKHWCFTHITLEWCWGLSAFYYFWWWSWFLFWFWRCGSEVFLNTKERYSIERYSIERWDEVTNSIIRESTNTPSYSMMICHDHRDYHDKGGVKKRGLFTTKAFPLPH